MEDTLKLPTDAPPSKLSKRMSVLLHLLLGVQDMFGLSFLTPVESDTRSLLHDWGMVGNDIRKATGEVCADVERANPSGNAPS